MQLEALLQQYFGLSHFRPTQKEIITALLEKKDVVALLPTGAGKSLCFSLPALLFPNVTLVISPLLALMADQVAALQGKGILAEKWDSTTSVKKAQEIRSALQTGKLRLLFLSPEKLLSANVTSFLLSQKISHICLDEAHCLSTWGHDFRPEYRQVHTFVSAYEKEHDRPVLSAFTATATANTVADIVSTAGLRHPEIYSLPLWRSNLAYTFCFPQSELQKRQMILAFLRHWKNELEGTALLYAATRQETLGLTNFLKENGFKQAQAFHAGLPEETKRRRLESFQTERSALLVATSAFGMGIDKSNVRMVLHHSVPPSLEAYVQEAGRAGRDGLPAWPVLLYREEDLIRNLSIWQKNASLERKKILQQQAERFAHLIQKPKCLQQQIAEHFSIAGQKQPAKMACSCSICQPSILQQVTPTKTPRKLPDSSDLARFFQLKLQRKRLAAQLKIPPYFLGSDKTLLTIAQNCPKTWAELKALAGVGHARLFYWGKEILAITAA